MTSFPEIQNLAVQVTSGVASGVMMTSELALEAGCMVYVTGSVYLAGKIIEEHVSREGADLWGYLEAHPPRDETEG